MTSINNRSKGRVYDIGTEISNMHSHCECCRCLHTLKFGASKSNDYKA